MSIAKSFDDVTVTTKANVYFEGKVVSHTIHLRTGEKKTLGIIYPGSFHFTTDAPERMDVVAGTCRVRLAGDAEWRSYDAGAGFDVPGKSAFDIAVETGLAEYVCSFR
jgi:uncharacterized protein YaiE (UPF0345 family)